MPRPRCCRRIAGQPACKVFTPAGARTDALEEVCLSLEEYEAIRLADHDGLYQEEAAARMGVSRQTFGRTIEKARGKVARALVLGCALRIETADAQLRDFLCSACGHLWKVPCGTGKPKACPGCGGRDFQCTRCPGPVSPASALPVPNTPNQQRRKP
jgi:predicted DNA-binding protein (UPF0251 family)